MLFCPKTCGQMKRLFGHRTGLQLGGSSNDLSVGSLRPEYFLAALRPGHCMAAFYSARGRVLLQASWLASYGLRGVVAQQQPNISFKADGYAAA